MEPRLRRVAISAGLVGLFAVAALVVHGCDGMSPFLAAQFATTIQTPDGQGLARGSPLSDSTNDSTAGDSIQSVCDLPARMRGLSITVANASQQSVRFSITFAVSAGPGGFVCDEELQDYINAGYSDALVPGSGNIITVGCDTLTLLSGNQLLTMEFGIGELGFVPLPPAEGDANNLTAQTVQLVRRDNRSPFIPLPEIIVFGDEDADFVCTGGQNVGDLCSQRGFVYVSAANLPVGKAVEASRIQGTVCNTDFGTAPEWRLDKTISNQQVQPYQYAAGGAIIVTVLDRSADGSEISRNQAVWLVTDSDGDTIHFPEP